MGRKFAFALIVSAVLRDRIESTHIHLQSKAVDYRHQGISSHNPTLAAHTMLSSSTSRQTETAGDLHLHMKERGHFGAQCSGMRRLTCKFCNTASSRLLLTTARRLVSNCFELSAMEITLWFECDGRHCRVGWGTSILIEDISSNPASTTTYISSGKG